MQTILGAGGTIASDLVRELQTYTDKLRFVSRNPKKFRESDELFPADLSNPAVVDQAVAGSEIVYLMVGFEYSIKTWRSTWPPLVKAVIDACEKHKAKLVFFDNVYMYDPNTVGHMTELNPINPSSKKGKVRAEIANLILEAAKSGRIQALIARSADFYGPKNDKSFIIETVYKNFAKKKSAMILGRSDKIHTFTYTPDAAKATAILGNTPDAYNQVWHVPTDPAKLTGSQWVELFAKEMNVPNKFSTMPVWAIKLLGLFIPFMKEMGEMMYQYNHDYFFDSSKFEKRFGLKATPAAEAVRLTVAAYRSEGK
jgi:nucleoside-diphosphate-sugar epimerase